MNRPAALSRGQLDALDPADAYDIAAPFYDEWKWQRFWRHSELPLIAAEVAAFVARRPGGARLIDIGCGTGKYLERLAPYFEEAIGVDVSEQMLAVAARRVAGRKLVRGEAAKLPIDSVSADLVLSTRMLSHVAEPRQTIGEMVRVLRRGGLLILSDIATEHDYEHTRLPLGKGHVYVQTHKHPFEQLAEMAEGFGLSLVRSIPILADEHYKDGRSKLGLRAKGKVGWIAVWRYA